MDQALSQAQLASSQAWLEAAAFGLLLCDANLTVLRANGRCAAWLDSSSDELQGQSVCDLLQLAERERPQILQALAQQQPWQGLTRSKGRALKVEIRPAGAGAVVSLLDYSADLEHLQKLSEAKSQAEQSNEARSRFLSYMSHELRTPLNAIIGFTQLLKVSSGLDARERDNVAEIEKAGASLLQSINELLDLSRIEAGKLKLSDAHVDLGALLKECTTLIAPLATPRSITLETRLARADLLVADYLRLKQILLNLLSNAVKYNHDGGRVVVRCFDTTDARLRLEICDSGSGLAPERLRTIFSPFERLDSSDGSGIGLLITRRLVALMEGEIGVFSQAERGSVFWVDLPHKRLSVLESMLHQYAPGAGAALAPRGPLFWIGARTPLFDVLENLRELRPALVLRRYATLATLDALATEQPALVLLSARAAQELRESSAAPKLLPKLLKAAPLRVVVDSSDNRVALAGENAVSALPLPESCKLTALLDLLEAMGGTEES